MTPEHSHRRHKLVNLLHTPLGDLFRGQVCGKEYLGALARSERHLEGVVNKSPLPESLRTVIYRVCRRTRLWRTEQVDVAEEFIVHFREGLDAGHTPEGLLESFGDVRRTAKLRGVAQSQVWRVGCEFVFIA